MKPLSFFALFFLCLSSFNTTQAQDARLMAIADSLHNTFVSIDTHNDASLKINYPNQPASTPKGQVSFPQMVEGGLDVAFFAAYVSQGPRTPERHQKTFEDIDFQVKGLKAYTKEHESEATVVYNTTDIRNAKSKGLRAMAIAIENGYCIGDDIKNVAYFREMGVQMMTLCHNGNNEICDSYRDTVEHGGLSPFGREVVKEMNRVGMIIDMSHASKASTLEAAAISSDPIMVSHSGVYTLFNSLRNVSDEEILAIAAKGGLIQVGIGGFFLSSLPRTEVTVTHLVDHIDYVVKLVGIDYVGIGSDFDGGGGVTDCSHMGEMKRITVELLRRGYTPPQIAKIWGGNVMRLMDRVQMQDKHLIAIADSLHNTFISIDTHNDASLRITFPDRPSRSPGQVSFPLMKQGRLDAAFFAAFVSQGPRTQEGRQNAFENVDTQIRSLKKYVQERTHEAEIAYNTNDIRRIKPTGRSTMVLAIENGYCIGTDLSKVKHFSDLGVQMMTLCHSRHNDICDSSSDTTKLHGGLSPFGQEVVKEMNRLGMIIDMSHASKASTLQAVAISSDPIMCSHSGAYAVREVPRNLSDEEIIAIANKGGVIQVVLLASYLSPLPRTEVTVKHFVDHVDYLVNKAGIEHVGIGSDFDGGAGFSDCNNMGEMKNITIELLRRGYKPDEIAKIWGGNTMRLMDQVQKRK